MMHLHAQRIIYPNRLIQVQLEDCYKMSDVEIDQVWRQSFLKSVSTQGMLNPILVCTEDTLEKELYQIFRGPFEYTGHLWRVFTGNNRFHWALDNNYTTIDAYEITSCEDWHQLNRDTFLEAKQFEVA